MYYSILFAKICFDRSIDRFEKVMLYFDETSNNGRWCNNRRNSVGGKI